MPIINVEQGSEAWKVLRRTKITSTMASVITGCNPFKSRLQLYYELTGVSDPDEPNAAMRLGTDLEPIARKEYIRQVGFEVEPIVYQSDTLPWALCSYDGYNSYLNRAVEIKAGKKAYELSVKGIIPDYYKCQMSFAMMVKNLGSMDYFTYWEGKTILMQYDRDEAYIEAIQRECERFYSDLKTLTPPTIDPFEDIGISDAEWNERTNQTWNNALKGDKNA